MAKTPGMQCTRMKLLTQLATLETKTHRFSLIKGLYIYEKCRFLNKKAFSFTPIYLQTALFFASGQAFNRTELMFFGRLQV